MGVKRRIIWKAHCGSGSQCRRSAVKRCRECWYLPLLISTPPSNPNASLSSELRTGVVQNAMRDMAQKRGREITEESKKGWKKTSLSRSLRQIQWKLWPNLPLLVFCPVLLSTEVSVRVCSSLQNKLAANSNGIRLKLCLVIFTLQHLKWPFRGELHMKLWEWLEFGSL